MAKRNIIQVTVVSAATIITFTGAALIIPRPTRAENLNSSVTVEDLNVNQTLTFDEIAQIEDTIDFYAEYGTRGIRDQIKRIDRWKLNSDVLEYLGITRSEAFESKLNGKSFQEIASEKGLDPTEIANIFEDKLIERLNQRLKEGNVSQARYEKIVSNLDDMRQKFIEGVY